MKTKTWWIPSAYLGDNWCIGRNVAYRPTRPTNGTNFGRIHVWATPYRVPRNKYIHQKLKRRRNNSEAQDNVQPFLIRPEFANNSQNVINFHSHKYIYSYENNLNKESLILMNSLRWDGYVKSSRSNMYYYLLVSCLSFIILSLSWNKWMQIDNKALCFHVFWWRVHEYYIRLDNKLNRRQTLSRWQESLTRNHMHAHQNTQWGRWSPSLTNIALSLIKVRLHFSTMWTVILNKK